MAHHAEALPAGSLLSNGRYRVLHEINRGATAVVYAAEDLSPGKQQALVALKVMYGPDLVPVKVVKREIEFSARAEHANIVRLLDVFADGPRLVIAWELIMGPDLLDLLNEHGGRLAEPQACFYFAQLLLAVTYMHDNGYTHRDIKPENCMIQRHNHQLKLIDFGLSKHLQSVLTRGVGTPDYLSPEMLQAWNVHLGLQGTSAEHPPAASPAYDARAVDAWAMGVLLYLLCTGKYPFEDPAHPHNLPVTIQNVLAGRVRPFPPHVSTGCRALITGLLQLDPTRRTTLQELTCNAWLLEQASQWARPLGRLGLISPLLAAQQQQNAQQQRYHQSVETATSDVTSVSQQHPAVMQGWPSGGIVTPPPDQRPSVVADAPAGPALGTSATSQQFSVADEPSIPKSGMLTGLCAYIRRKLQ